MKKLSTFAVIRSLVLLTASALGTYACVIDERPFPGDTNTTKGPDGCTAECCGDDMCEAPANECLRAICADAKCGTENVAANQPTATQKSGDCKVRVCDGDGDAISQNDDEDVHDDDLDCTMDLCENGSPKTEPEATGAACDDNGGKVCNGAGQCVECNENPDCKVEPFTVCDHGTSKCVDKACTDGGKGGDETDIDCGGPCKGCDTGQTCADGGDCYNQICTGGSCAAPTCMDGVQNGGDYMENNGETDVDCGGPCSLLNEKCGPLKKCNVDADCAGNECSGMGGTCVPNCSDGVQNNDESDIDCGGPVAACAQRCAVGEKCAADDANCLTELCLNDACVGKLPNGGMCGSQNKHCESGHCVDQVCCNTSCNGLCEACNLGGAGGQCGPIAPGTDPANECPGSQLCSGTGLCKKAPGDACAQAADCLSGSCVDGFCCDSQCNGLCKACSAAKTGGANGTCANIPANSDPESECVGMTVCNGSGACAQTVNGLPCSVAAECMSGFCVDGVCCNNACGGVCQACTAAKKGAGSNGQCGPVAGTTDPDNECNGNSGSDACDGSGVCKRVSGISCAGNSDCLNDHCSDSVCCNTACAGACRSCNLAGSKGTCSFIPSGLDPANECSGSDVCDGSGSCKKANGTACGLATECLSNFCVDGVCCNTACDANCTYCDGIAASGTCVFVPLGSDPRDDCTGIVTTCNGNGGCQ